MSVSRFIISTLAAAGFGGQDGAADSIKTVYSPLNADPDPKLATRLYTQEHLFTLAGHRSHSSHSSHSSHRSGYSGGHYSHTSHRSGMGGYYYPTPSYSTPVPAAPTPAPARPAISPLLDSKPVRPTSSGSSTRPDTVLPALSGRSKRFAEIIRKVQMALYAQGFYRGRIDGVVGPSTRDALRLFQKVSHLDVTGTITSQTLDALRISTR